MSTLAQSLARTLGTTSTLGMESVDVDVNIGQDAILDEDGASVSALAPATNEPIIEAQETELAEEDSELASLDSEAESSDNDIETLESIQLHLEKSIEHGGLDTVSYEMLNVTMDHIYRKYGFSAANVLPSMESFNDDNLGQTTVSMEKVSDTLKTVKEGATQLIKKLWFQLKEFLKGMFTFSASVRKRAEAVAKQAKAKASSETPKEPIKIYNARKLAIDGKIPDKSALIAAYKKTTSGTLTLNGVLKAYMDANADLIRHAVDNSTGMDVTKFESLNNAVENAGKRFIALNDSFVFGNAQFNAVVYGGEANQHAVQGVEFKYEKSPERGSDSENYKTQALSTSEISDVCKNIIQCCNEIDSISKLYTKSNLDKSIIVASDAKTENTKEIKKAVRALIKTQGNVVKYVTGTNKAMLDYCVQSLQATSKKDAPKADDKDAK